MKELHNDKYYFDKGFALQILQDLYDSEINASISWMWDGGIDVKLGGLSWYNQNSAFDDSVTVKTIKEACEWLKEQAFIYYPNSKFTHDYNRGETE